MKIYKQKLSLIQTPAENLGYIFLDADDNNKLKVKTSTNVITFDTSDATAEAADILSGKTAYVNGEKVTGTLEVSTSGSELPNISEANNLNMIFVIYRDDLGDKPYVVFGIWGGLQYAGDPYWSGTNILGSCSYEGSFKEDGWHITNMNGLFEAFTSNPDDDPYDCELIVSEAESDQWDFNNTSDWPTYPKFRIKGFRYNY